VSAETHQPGAAATGAPITSVPSARSAYEDKVVHRYDDIEEFDNHLPNWWLFTLYAAVVFAIGYWFHYEVLHSGPTTMESYEQSVAADRRAAADRARRAGAMTDDALVTLSHDQATVAAGQQIFTTNCVACHGANAGGVIGPNLTDRAWLHGGRPTQIFRTVLDGVPAKGMVAWGPQLGDERVQSVVAYVLTLRNTNVAGGKAPQGDVVAE
jgi:cytochrome c oxidase cbb3-type subunit 3